MKYIAAYLLASLGGNSEPSKEDISKILASVGIDADEGRVAMVVDELKGKSVEEVIAEGQSKLASVPSGGAVAAGSGSGGESKTEEKEEKKEEKKVSEDEESDDDMGFGLFD